MSEINVPGSLRKPGDIECWGHRGASAHLPENTLASFRAAILEGAHGIESDVHATSDGVILMFHDPTLDRTTTGKGLIRKQPWKGVIEHARTVKEPIQPIPRFEELVDLLMEEENRHVLLNIDCKMQNDPETLFPEMARIISKHANWETVLAPRLILGLWHPLFLKSAYTHLPLLKRYHIGFSLSIARQFFWDACDGFSIAFPILVGTTGQAFIRDCVKAGKSICVWTVNDPGEMRVALSWGVRAVLTDRVGAFVELRNEVVADPEKLQLPGLSKYVFGWSNWRYFTVAHPWIDRTQLDMMRTMCYQPGPLVMPDLSEFSMEATPPVLPPVKA
ncbi:PLC-like phosphodiesterase [Naematelia encephala]|uniref:PLC-like phosphodiesterase n=1 Tax=Naematelia encephala TaxID=71784 RepID=A0A1Y2BF27_9TREE|nr:PLC-like phosphodiesterase [Naematelia encephala]